MINCRWKVGFSGIYRCEEALGHTWAGQASRQPNYERFQVASDECTVSRKTDSLYRRKRREQSVLHVKRLRWN